jgi:hypothetical protein
MFQMLQQFGVLDVSKFDYKIPTTGPAITLPDGTKLIPLDDGNFGVIRKS